LPGEIESGDGYVVAPFQNGVLIAVADGLGHGCEAAAAARLATESLRSRSQWPVIDLIEYCHAALQKSRGVVLSLASIDADKNQMNWIGMGNVEGALFRADPTAQRTREILPHRGGVIGYQLPPLRVQTLSIASGDTVILATDGIEGGCLTASPAD